MPSPRFFSDVVGHNRNIAQSKSGDVIDDDILDSVARGDITPEHGANLIKQRKLAGQNEIGDFVHILLLVTLLYSFFQALRGCD